MSNKLIKLIKLLFTTIILIPQIAFSGVIFDSSANPGSFVVSETRNSQFNYGSVLQFNSNTDVTGINVWTSSSVDQNIMLSIWASGSSTGTGTGTGIGTLLETFTTSITGGLPQNWLDFAANYNFLAGNTYDIAITGSDANGQLTGTWVAYSNYSQNGITEISNNANVYGYGTTLTDSGYAGVSPYIQLTNNTVPEPTSITLLGIGLFGFAASRRKNNQA